jgi:hypothetical protein
MESWRAAAFRLERIAFDWKIQNAVETNVAEIGNGCDSRWAPALGLHGNGKL